VCVCVCVCVCVVGWKEKISAPRSLTVFVHFYARLKASGEGIVKLLSVDQA
jgi:hypothetical protein